MSSLISEVVLFTVPNGAVIGPNVNQVAVPLGTFTDLVVTGTINSQAISGNLVFSQGSQLLTNKLLDSSSTWFVNTVDNTTRVAIDARGSTGTTSTFRFVQAASRVYTVPDPGVDCSIVTSEGNLTINGAKTFTNLTATTFYTNTVTEATTGSGVNISGNALYINNSVKYSSATQQTVGGVTSAIYTVATTSNTSYYLTVKLVGADSTGDTITIKSSVKVKNNAGVMTLGTPFDNYQDADAALSGAGVAFQVSGGNVLVNVTGVSGLTINWRGILKQISAPFN